MVLSVEDAIGLAVKRGLLELHGPILPSVVSGVEVSALAPRSWETVGTWFSAALNLTAWPSKRGCTLVSGNRVVCRILNPDSWADGVAARAVAERITGEPMPTDAAAIARKLWERCGPPHFSSDSQKALITLPGYFYTRCLPGLYPDVTKYDLSNCYGTIISRLPSPYVTAYESGNLKFKTRNLDRIAWKQLQDIARESKYVGRALYGTSLGGKKLQKRWHKGVKTEQKLPMGPYMAFGLLVARIAHEITQIASITESGMFAYTDCVVVPSSGGVPVWDMAGLAYKQVSRGESDIININTYRVGLDATVPYRVNVMGQYHHAPGGFSMEPTIIPGDTLPPQNFSNILFATA